MGPELWRWLQAFAFTQVVEVPIYRRALHGRFWAAFGASALTHPFVWFVFPLLHGFTYWERTALSEVFAVVVEAAYLRLFGLRRAFTWSLAANGSSFGLGLLSRAAFGWP